MIRPRKMKEMIALSSFEEGRGRRSLRIGRLSRSDYIDTELIKAFVCSLAGLCLLGGLLAASRIEALLNLLVYLNLPWAGLLLFMAAAVLVAGYVLLAWFLAAGRYRRAEQELISCGKHVDKLRSL